MSQKAETNFKVIVKKWLKEQPNTYHVKVSQVALRGVPDILACMSGRFVAIELKKDAKAKIDTLQSYTLHQIATAGGFAAVVHPGNWLAVQCKIRWWIRDGEGGMLCGTKWTNPQAA